MSKEPHFGTRLEDFEPLWEAESTLARECWTGEPVRIGWDVPPVDAPRPRRIRASFLRYLALGGCERCRPGPKGVRVWGAYIEGDGPERAATRGLDLEGCTLTGDLGLLSCRVPDMILLRRAKLRLLNLNGSHLGLPDGAASEASAKALSADGLEANDGVFLRSVEATGEVRLVGAKLGGNLECNGGTLTAGESGRALAADRLETGGGVFLQSVKATGEVRLVGAKLGGTLSCIGGTFTAHEEGGALVLSNAHVTGAFFLRSGKTDGEDRAARVVGRLDLRAAYVATLSDDVASWPAKGDLLLDRFRYGAIVAAPVSAEERLRWLGLQEPARVGVDFWPQPYEQLAKVLREMGHLGDARAVLVEKERLQRRSLRETRWARWTGGRLHAWFMGLQVWERGAFAMDFKAAFARFKQGDPRRKLLAEGLAEEPFFEKNKFADFAASNQPIDAFSEFLDAKYRSPPARWSPMALRWANARAGFVYYGQCLLDWVFATTLGYGWKPYRAFYWLIGFWAVGAVLYALTWQAGAFKPNSVFVLRAPEWVVCAADAGEEVILADKRVTGAFEARHETQLGCYLEQAEAGSYPAFNTFFYSADVLVPLVHLELQEYWLPDEDKGWLGPLARFVHWLQIIAGWGLSLLAVAGFSGLVRND